jgi:hypothetical protein
MLPKDFFTAQTMLTLTGAAGAVYVVSAVYQNLLNRDPKLVAFLLSMALSIGGMLSIGIKMPLDYVVMLINGCLIFLTARGGAATAAAPAPPGGIGAKLAAGQQADAPLTRTWRSPW